MTDPGSELEAAVRVADRRYVFVVVAACAVGWGYRIWPLPLLAFGALEAASELTARRAARVAAPVRLRLVRDPGETAARPFDRAA
jgi:hypothetical protein